MNKQPANGKYIWCLLGDGMICPEGNGKSLGYALTIKHHKSENWKLYKLIPIKSNKYLTIPKIRKILMGHTSLSSALVKEINKY